MKTKIMLLFAFWTATQTGFSQSLFQDLNFEQANPVYDGNNYTIASTFPGWQAFIGTTPIYEVWYDGISAGGPVISLVNNYPPYGLEALQGNYSADLFGAVLGPNTYSVSLSQTGTVPAGTKSIEMDANQASSSSFAVTLGGEQVNMVPLQTFANYTLWGGNIPSFAGQNVRLSITELPPATQQYSPSVLEFDNITFSTTTVTPEPNTLALAVMGGLALAARRWRTKGKS